MTNRLEDAIPGQRSLIRVLQLCCCILMSAALCAQVQRKLNRLVVVDAEGKLAGILSRGDIMRATINHFR